MSTELQNNLEAIKLEKDTKIIPENIKSGVTVLGVTGNVEPDKPDQNKTVDPSTSSQTVVADTGYELAQVTVNPVTSSIDANITANNIKNGVSILGVTGTYEGDSSGDVKLFNTTEEMNADPDPQENGLAVVYGDSFTGVQLESEFSVVKFPYQVTLSSAMTDYVSRYV